MTPAKIKQVFEILRTKNPSPTTELIYNNDFELLVAVVLSAQSTDIRVNIVTNILFSKANSAHKMVKLNEKEVSEIIQTLGLYKSKAKNVIKLSQQLVDLYDGLVPKSYDELIQLAGVGRKTANVILNTLYHQPTIAVDTHVYRVSKRIGLASKRSKTPLAVENDLLKSIPKPYLINAHHWLILHGRYTCKARNPGCKNCCIQQYCQYENKNLIPST